MHTQFCRPQFRIAREGKGWIAVAPEFRNLETSPFGYALCPDAAISQLLADPAYRALAARRRWPKPAPADFVEIELLQEDEPVEDMRPALRLVVSR